MSDPEKLEKLLNLLEGKLKRSYELCMQYQREINKSLQKMKLLEDTNQDYKSRLMLMSQQAIAPQLYQQFTSFIAQIEHAIKLQNQVIESQKGILAQESRQYHMLKQKADAISEMITKVLDEKAYQEAKIESQYDTDLYNQRNHDK